MRALCFLQPSSSVSMAAVAKFQRLTNSSLQKLIHCHLLSPVATSSAAAAAGQPFKISPESQPTLPSYFQYLNSDKNKLSSNATDLLLNLKFPLGISALPASDLSLMELKTSSKKDLEDDDDDDDEDSDDGDIDDLDDKDVIESNYHDDYGNDEDSDDGDIDDLDDKDVSEGKYHDDKYDPDYGSYKGDYRNDKNDYGDYDTYGTYRHDPDYGC